MKQIVGAQVARIGDPELRDLVARLLIEPRLHDVPWDYGEVGRAYPCWIVADLRPNLPDVVVYCDQGFGPGEPFGIIDAALSSMGMDSQWFRTLEDALRSCGFVKNPPGYQVG